MLTPIYKREAPDGYTESWDDTIWNVGYIFRWSEVYSTWLDCNRRITVKPKQSLAEAYGSDIREPLRQEYSVFFVDH